MKNRSTGLYQNLKLFCIKGNYQKSGRQHTEEKILTNLICDKGLIPRIYNKHNNQKTIQLKTG